MKNIAAALIILGSMSVSGCTRPEVTPSHPKSENSSDRPDLKPWEQLAGDRYTARKEVPFETEEDARTYLKRVGQDGAVEKRTLGWVAVIPETISLLKLWTGRQAGPEDRVENGIYFKPDGHLCSNREDAVKFAREKSGAGEITLTSVEGKPSYFVPYFSRIDLLPRGRDQIIARGLADRWVIRDTVPGVSFSHVQRGSLGETLVDGEGMIGVSATYRGPESSAPRVSVRMLLKRYSGMDPYFNHLHMTRLEPRRTEFGTILLEVRERRRFAEWKYGERAYFSLAFGEGASGFLESYLKKYPSSWGSDFVFDRLGWAKRHVRMILAKMKDCVDEEPPYKNGVPRYGSLLLNIGVWFNCPHLGPINDSLDHPEARREHHKTLTAWWNDSGKDVKFRPGAPVSVIQVKAEVRKGR